MKLVLAFLICAFALAEASLRDDANRRTLLNSPSSDDVDPLALAVSKASDAILVDKLDLSNHGDRWEAFLQHSTTQHHGKDARMLLPRLSQLNLWEYMMAVDTLFSPVYSKFMTLMVAADMEDELRSATGTTLFAPDDAAISSEQQDFLLAPENENILVRTMEYHIVPNIVSYLSVNSKVTDKAKAFLTNAGDSIEVSVNADGVLINQNTRAVAFTLAMQSILYRIDRILMPPSMEQELPEIFLQAAVDWLEGGEFEFPIVIPDGFMADSVSSDSPSMAPVLLESASLSPLDEPSDQPSTLPSDAPSKGPSDVPSVGPSDTPSAIPSDTPSLSPSDLPSTTPSDSPSTTPSDSPSTTPSDAPSMTPSDAPSMTPSDAPSTVPSAAPLPIPSKIPTMAMSAVPSKPTSSDAPSTAPGDVIVVEAATSVPNSSSAEANDKALDEILSAGTLDYDEDEASALFALFLQALSMFGPLRGGNRDVTFFIPRGFNDIDVDFGSDLNNPAYNLHLLSLVRFHITKGTRDAPELADEGEIDMLSGGQVEADSFGKGNFALDSFSDEKAVILSSTEGSFGMVYVIDHVLIPQWMTLNVMSLMETYDDELKCPLYSKFRALIVAAGLDDALRTLEDVTVFAPQNDAISQDLSDYLLLPTNEFLVINVVTYHVISDAVVSHLEVEAAVDSSMTFETYQTSDLTLSVREEQMFVNEVPVLAVSLARRAIVFRIGSLLIPEMIEHLMPEGGMGATGMRENAIPETVSSSLEQTIQFPPDRTFLNRSDGDFIFG